MSNKKVLVSGAGIAGPTLAYWLIKYGFQVTIVEQSQRQRSGGYIIDFWGKGYEVAEKMRIVPQLQKLGYNAKQILLLNSSGDIAGGFNADVLRLGLNGKFLSILRSDLAGVIADKIKDHCEIHFGDSIVEIANQKNGTEALFRSGRAERFDLVIGADGLHSKVRSLMFGESQNFKVNLGYYAAAFSVDSYPKRDEDIYVCYTVPGKQIARFALNDGRTVFFLVACAPSKQNITLHNESTKSRASQLIDGLCVESGEILEALSKSEDFYCDDVTQIRLPGWHKDRIALVGDAAYCPSLLAGQGAALAMCGSYVLAGELMQAGGDYIKAFERYQSQLFQFMLKKQIAAEKIGVWFAPRTSFGLFVRNQTTKLLAIPALAEAFATSTVADKLELPNYSDTTQPSANFIPV
jgi:2-polyprenyl-6-methoxyphenol hydroxylase-like FAD-dependent oxidoreductase